MNEFQKQIEENASSFLNEFNNDGTLTDVRQLYKTQFDIIEGLIANSSPKLAVEDIASLDSNLKEQVFSNKLLLQQINVLISKKEISVSDIK